MSRRNDFTQGPIKLSVIIASLLASACSDMNFREGLSDIFEPESDISMQKPSDITPVRLEDLTNNEIEQLGNANDPKFILTEAANIALEEKKYGEALNYWSQLINQYPDYAPGYIGYSKTGRRINAHQRILGKLYDFKSRFPNDVSVMTEIAKVHYELRDYTQALEEIDNTIPLEDRNWKLYSFRGVIASKLNYTSEAEASYAKALELSPDNPTVLNNLAVTMMEQGQYNDAEFYAIKAIENPAANIQLYRTYAKILALKGERDRAQEFLTKKLGDEDEANKVIGSVSAEVSKPVLWGRR